MLSIGCGTFLISAVRPHSIDLNGSPPALTSERERRFRRFERLIWSMRSLTNSGYDVSGESACFLTTICSTGDSSRQKKSATLHWMFRWIDCITLIPRAINHRGCDDVQFSSLRSRVLDKMKICLYSFLCVYLQEMYCTIKNNTVGYC